jgi:hypothetical protein
MKYKTPGEIQAAAGGFRNPDGKFRRSPAANQDQPTRGEVAFADPRRLFKGSEKHAAFNPSNLVGTRGLQLYDEMRRDDQVKAALAFKKQACLATGWDVMSPKGKSPDWAPTRFMRYVLENMDPTEIGSATLDGDLREILTALDYGFSVTEKLHVEIDSGEWQGMIGLRSLKTRSPHGIQFAQDVYGNLADDGIVQAANNYSPGGRLPRNKFVLFTYDSRFGNPYGTSDLEAAYFHWWVKTQSTKWLAMLLERFGIPPIFGLYNPSRYTGGASLSELRAILTNLQAATTGIIPRPDKDALEFWAPGELAANATRIFVPALEYMNSSIARAILMPSLIGMTSDTSQGSYARSRVHFDVFLLVVEAIRTDLEMVAMNHQVVRPLCDLNFPDLGGEYPIWKLLPLTDDLRIELVKEWGDLIGKTVVSRGPDDEEHIRKLLQFPEAQGEELPLPESILGGPNGSNNSQNGNGNSANSDAAPADTAAGRA